MSDSRDSDSSPPLPQDAAALTLILTQPIELFCDLAGQPRVRLPSCSEGLSEEVWSLRSERFRGWIADLVWEQSRRLLLDREIDRILNVLEGKAWRDPRHDLELCEAAEQEPVLESLLLLLEKQPHFEGSMTALLQHLTKTADIAGLAVRDRLWPKGSPQLSQRIRKLEPLLAKAQITVERNRNSFVRTIVLNRKVAPREPLNDAAPSPPSVVPSHAKPQEPQGLHRNDALDPQKRAELFARITSPPLRSDP